jgi:hypothetical protein
VDGSRQVAIAGGVYEFGVLLLCDLLLIHFDYDWVSRGILFHGALNGLFTCLRYDSFANYFSGGVD